MLITPNMRTRLMGPVLAIEAATQEDAGVYRCVVSNVVSEKTTDIRLVVSSPLQVEVTPNSLTMHLGGTAEFKCNIETSVSYSLTKAVNILMGRSAFTLISSHQLVFYRPLERQILDNILLGAFFFPSLLKLLKRCWYSVHVLG